MGSLYSSTLCFFRPEYGNEVMLLSTNRPSWNLVSVQSNFNMWLYSVFNGFFVEEPEDGLIWSEYVYQLGRLHYLIKIVV